MAVRRYVARWCEGDFDENGECLDQEWMTETFDTLFDAQVAAFKNANAQATCVHCYCEVDVLELGEHGYETLRTLVNHHDFGNKWSGWITEDKYKAQYGE